MMDAVLNVFAPLVRRYEGLHKIATSVPTITVVPYYCPAGILTIGYGHTHGVKLGQRITEEEADALLRQDMLQAVNASLVMCPVLATLSPERLAAIADFTFNLGAGRLQASTLRRRINAGEYEDVPGELRRWVYAAGKVLPGLVARRESEAQLWLQSDDKESTNGKLDGTTGTSRLLTPFTSFVSGFDGLSNSIKSLWSRAL